jgi:hypothetical protein
MSFRNLCQESSISRQLPVAAPCKHEGLSHPGQQWFASNEAGFWAQVRFQ